MTSGIQLIKKSEGFREFAYPDPASDLARAVRARKLKVRWGFQPARDIIAALPQDLQSLSGAPWTCGYGETKGVTIDTRWSEPEAFSRLKRRYSEFESGVRAACTVPPGPNQLAAMTSLVAGNSPALDTLWTMHLAKNAGNAEAVALSPGV